MNKDAELIAEAYLKVLEEATHCKAAKNGCDCDKCDDCEKNQKIDEGKDQDGDGKKDFDDVKIARMVASGMSREEAVAKVKGKKKSKVEENTEIAQAYETILEYKLINKKFARRYNKLTSAMLKSQPGSEEYGKYKTEREDLVSILKDHGMTPKDLEEYLVKKEKETPLPEVPDQNSHSNHNQYGDNSYSDTADIPASDTTYQQDMAAPQAEVATMPPDQTVQAPQA